MRSKDFIFVGFQGETIFNSRDISFMFLEKFFPGCEKLEIFFYYLKNI